MQEWEKIRNRKSETRNKKTSGYEGGCVADTAVAEAGHLLVGPKSLIGYGLWEGSKAGPVRNSFPQTSD